MKRLWTEFVCGIGLFTRIPTKWLYWGELSVELRRSVWCWPLVGGAIGYIEGAVFALLRSIGLSGFTCAAWTIAVSLILTGALHEDGLADCADGLFGGATPARRLEIMRDSRIGSFGTLAIGTALLIRTNALASIQVSISSLPALLGIGAALARTSMLLPLLTLPPARKDGLASQIYPPHMGACIVAATISLGFIAYLPNHLKIVVTLMSLFPAIILSCTAKRKINGFTGDLLGSVCLITQLAILTAYAAFYHEA